MPHQMTTAPLSDRVQSLVSEWLELDKDEATRNEIEALVNDRNEDELKKRLASKLEFGTAGLRAAMGAGFSRLNPLTILQASQGLCQYILDQPTRSDVHKTIVIGHDHRHNSERFAKLTAAVFRKKGFGVYYYRQIVHTPLVPFGVLKFKAAAGIMITASHNPREDNGYKVYWSNGCQIIPPHDEGIAKCIEQNRVAWTWDTSEMDGQLRESAGAAKSDFLIDPFEEVKQAYFEAVKTWHQRLVQRSSAVQFNYVYTAMHGVGLNPALQVCRVLDLPSFAPVSVQAKPDPDFPTVTFPNPEEGKGALAESINEADRQKASYIFANDPDADRFAFAARIPDAYKGSNEDGSVWKIFTGNEIGAMIGAFLIERLKHQVEKPAVITTCVSSQMLGRIAKVEEVIYEETLTGFKWMGNAAQDLQSKVGATPIFAYEEAIGFMCGTTVYDKDGISCFGVFSELLGSLEAANKTIFAYLDGLYLKYGYFGSMNHYVICKDVNKIAKQFDGIRGFTDGSKDFKYPTNLGVFQVVSVRDLHSGFNNSGTGLNLPVSEASENLRVELQVPHEVVDDKEILNVVEMDPIVLTIRTSGTEPKIKYYSDFAINIKQDFKGDKLQLLNERIKPMANQVLSVMVRELKSSWLNLEQ